MNLVAWINKLIDEDELWKFYKSKEFMKLRKEVLRENHFECLECKRKGLITKATTVHHIKHVREFPHLALDKDNLLPVCKACHSSLHREKPDISQAKLIVVTGLPSSGKTTYVKEHMTPKDVVYDLDYLIDAMTYGNNNSNALRVVNGLLESFVSLSMRLVNINVYVIRTAPNSDELKLFNKYHAEFVDLHQDVNSFMSLDKFSDTEKSKILLKHDNYINQRKNKQVKFEERW